MRLAVIARFWSFVAFGFTLFTSIFFVPERLNADSILSGVLPYKHFGEEEGLTTKTVYAMIQDQEGFIWFATDVGVYRYDGKVFNHFTIRDGLSDNEVMNLQQDSKGRIWFLTLSGKISYWFKGKFYNGQNLRYLNDANPGGTASIFYEDSKGRIWIGSKQVGVIMIEDTMVTIFKLPLELRYYGRGTAFIFEDRKNSIWSLQIDKFINLTTKDTLQLPKRFENYAVSRNERVLYFVIEDSLCTFDGMNIQRLLSLKNFPIERFRINYIRKDGKFWLCTLNNGVYQINDSLEVINYLDGYSVTNVLTDTEGNLWFSTIDNGVFLLAANHNSIRNLNKESGLASDRVLSITHDLNNNIWLGYVNGHIDKITGSSIEEKSLKNSDDPGYMRISNLYSRDDTLWCGGDIGIAYYTGGKTEKVKIRGQGGKFLYAAKNIHVDKEKNMYVSFNNGMLEILKDSKGFHAIPILDSIVRCFSSIKLENGNLLISTNYGLKELLPHKFFRPYFPDATFDMIRAADMEIYKGQLIVATNDLGIYVFKDKSLIQHITTGTGLSDDNCNKFLLRNDRMYVATRNGSTVLKKRGENWEVDRIFNMQSGLLTNIINDVDVLNDSLYLATDKGLSIISLKEEKSVKYITNVIITGIVADVERNYADTTYYFDPGIGRLLIKFAYPVFDPMNRRQLEYRLISNEGQHTQWITTLNNEVEYSSFSPGKYSFEIRPQGLKNSKAAILNFVILPKWWQTYWARVFAVILCCSGIIYLIRLRIRSQYQRKLKELKQKNLIESERNRIASDMHDDIGGDLTQISIWMNILNKYELQNNDIVSKVSVLSDELLVKMEQIIWALDSMHNNSTDLFTFIRSYASDALSSSGIRLEYEIDMDLPTVNVSAFQRRNIFLIVKEFLTNTIKHSQATEVKIKIGVGKGKICIEYADNGRGFDMQMESDGHGLYTMKRRIAEINGTLNIESKPMQGFLGYIRMGI